MTEKIQSLDINFTIHILEDLDKDKLDSFSCGCPKLDDFFQNDILICAKNKYVSAYCAKNTNNEILALFTLAHDVVCLNCEEDKEEFFESTKYKIDDDYNNIFKKQILFPAINITYFGVSKNLQSKEIGTNILDYIVHTFTAYKLAGCQFITVDSLNNSRTNAFYAKHGFCNLTNMDSIQDTRRMYLPLQLYSDEFLS